MNAPPPQQYLALFVGLCALVLLMPTAGFAATPSHSAVNEVCLSLFDDARKYLRAGELEQAGLQLSVAIEESCEVDGDSEVHRRPHVADDELVFESDSCRQFYRRAEGHIADRDARSARDAVQSMDRLRCTWSSGSEEIEAESTEDTEAAEESIPSGPFADVVDMPVEPVPVAEPAETEEREYGWDGRAEEIRGVVDISLAMGSNQVAGGGLLTIEYYLDDYLAVTGRTGWLYGASEKDRVEGDNKFGSYSRTSFLPIHGGVKYYLAETYKVFGFAELGMTFFHTAVGMKGKCRDEERMDYEDCVAASEAPTDRHTTGRPSAFAGLGYEFRSAGNLSRIFPVFTNSQLSGGIYIPSIGDMGDFQAGIVQIGASF